MDITMTNTPTDNFTCCFDTASTLPRSLFEVSSEDNSNADIHSSHALSYSPCGRLFINIQRHIQNSLSSSLARGMLTFKFSHLLQDIAVDTLNSITRERSRIHRAQTCDDRQLPFRDMDRDVMVPLKIGHLHDDLGSF